MNLILTGMRGTGKTTLGKALAVYLGWGFLDLDEWIEAKTKKTVHELVMNECWEAFRKWEKKAVDACRKLEKTVIATGGGTLMDADNTEKLKAHGLVVLLVADLLTLKKNLAQSHSRPSLTDTAGATEKISALDELEVVWMDRRDRYHAVADLVHDTTHGMDLEGLLEKLNRHIKTS